MGIEINNNREVQPANITTKAAEVSDWEYERQYGEVARQASDAYYAELAQQVDEIYTSVGARAMRGVSYAGEDPTSLFIPEEQGPCPNRPA